MARGVVENQCIRPTLSLNRTRWSSTLALLNEMQSVKEYLQLVGPVLSAEQWSGVDFASAVLLPFYNCTQQLQRDACTVMEASMVLATRCCHLR